MMLLRDAFVTSAQALVASRMRSALTMLGIIIGIASVMILMAVGTSAQQLILRQVQGIGSNLVFIVPGGSGSSRFSSPASVQGIIIKTLNERDSDALKREPTIEKVSAEVRGQGKIVYENNDTTVTFQGVTEDFFAMRSFTAQKGSLLSARDIQSFQKVVVLGSAISTTLFGERDPIGKVLRLKDQSFTVIGVLEKKGVGPFGVDQDNLAIIPLSVAQKQLLGIDYFNVITVQVKNSYSVEFTKQRISSVLRQNHRTTSADKDDFTIRTQEDALSLLGNVTSIMKVFLTSIAAISLVVGGIGIMNIMLVAVVERTKEIGLRKAVGATNRDILLQFLLEALILTLLGGFLGILFGVTISGLIALLMSKVFELDWVFIIPGNSVLLGIAVSTMTGLVFGIYPARKAALKRPIEALRYE